jgi:hypothetical protein
MDTHLYIIHVFISLEKLSALTRIYLGAVQKMQAIHWAKPPEGMGPRPLDEEDLDHDSSHISLQREEENGGGS